MVAIDYLKEYPDTCSQVIQFGSNLIDFTRKWDSSEFATVLVPLGGRLDDSPIEALDAYLTVESVNNGSIYIQSSSAVAVYGWIEKTVTWDEVTDPAVLLEKAKTYLSDIQFDNMELELSALDLHYLNVDVEAVKLLDEIRVISSPHGLDRLFPVTKLEIPLDNPDQTQFKMGDTVKTSLTSVNNQINIATLQKIEGLPKAHSLLKEAKENATQIMNMATTGYITITKGENGSEELIISNVRDYTKADKLWKWNMNGFGYSKDGGKTFGLAMTMDGSIVANYITSGVLNANVIRAGVLKDYGGNFILDFTTGKLTMKKGSIQLGEYTDGHYNFEVDNDGNLYARNGTFAGRLAGASGTFGGKLVAVTGDFKGVVQAEDFLDRYGNSMMSGDKFSSKYLDVRGLNVNNRFMVDENGNVTIRGGSISWSAVTGTDKLEQRLDSIETSIPKLPKYITSTKITETTIESPTIKAGSFYGCTFYAEDDGYFSFCNSRGVNQGTISYDYNKGICIGAVDGILLHGGLRSVMIKDEYGESRAISYEWLQNHPQVAVFG